MEYYIDFDGVILDTSNAYYRLYMKHYHIGENNWNEILSETDFLDFFNNSNIINDSIYYLKLLSKDNPVSVLTKCTFESEALAKKEYLENQGLLIPVITLKNSQNKHDIVRPNPNRLLVDDNIENCKGWIYNNGIAYYYGYYNFKNVESIKSLKRLIK